MQDKSAEKNFFDEFAGGGYDVFDKNGYERIVGEFLKHFYPKPGFKIADLGCGTGAFTSKFLGRGLELHGMDISDGCIRYAKSAHPGIEFSAGDIEKTGYPDSHFDACFLSGVLHHFQDFTGVVTECRRILKPGGVLLGYDPNRDNPAMRLFRCKGSPFYISKGVTENERPLSADEISGTLARCGFKEHEVYAVSGVTFKYMDSKLSFAILPVYNIIEKALDMAVLRKRWGSFLITYARKSQGSII